MNSDVIFSEAKALSWYNNQFFGADLKGRNLAGRTLRGVCLRNANFDGADLTSACIEFTDISNTSFDGACLERASFRSVIANHTSFTRAKCNQSFWEYVDLTGTQFLEANLKDSTIYMSNLAQADLTDVDLIGGKLIKCNCDEVKFDRAVLEDVITLGSSFKNVDFSHTKQFTICREIIVEILRQEIADDVEQIKIVGSILLNRRWCYPEWAKILAHQNNFLQLAIKIFNRYPESGVVEALQSAINHEASSEITIESHK